MISILELPLVFDVWVDAEEGDASRSRWKTDRDEPLYLKLNLYNSGRNKGTAARIHLVIDCKVNEWFRSLFLPKIENGSPL